MSARPPFEPLFIYVLIAFVGFAIADLTILSVRDEFIPRSPPPPKQASPKLSRTSDRGAYGAVTSRNIFNSDGKIPDPLGGAGSGHEQDGPPIAGTLGFTLVGTIVHANPKKSVASVSLRGKPEPEAYMVDGEIKDGATVLARLQKIERNRAVYRNLQTGRLEFVEIKDDAKISFAGAKPEKPEAAITQVSDGLVKVKREELNKKLADLPSLLMQARAVPRMGPDGRVQCFQMVGIQPGSVYESLSIKVGDCIKSVNGEPIDSPAKAMDLFNQLKNSASIQLGIERDGSDKTMNFDIE